MKVCNLRKEDFSDALLFFNGWGMDYRIMENRIDGCDVFVFYDYRDMETCPGFPDLSSYENIYVVAWSMGVWAASYWLGKTGLRVRTSVALCGTESPIDDNYGISELFYKITLKGIRKMGPSKFYERMIEGNKDSEDFAGRLPERKDQAEELEALWNLCTAVKPVFPWDKAVIAREDKIFPYESQKSWWMQRGVEVLEISGGHYPFANIDLKELLI